jgi:hypothetical protein
MSRRIDIELTSARDDGTWTWRAAGALQPRGVLEGKVLYPGANVGDVARAEADFEIDGITILAVLPPKAKRPEPDRLEIIGSPRENAGVTSSLVSRQDRRDRDRDRDRDRPRDRDRDRDRDRGRDRARGERSQRETNGAADAAATPPRRAPRRERDTAGVDAAGAGRRARPSSPRAERRPPERPAPPPKPKPKRLNPANVHRSAVLEALPVEQRPIAEQVLRGGIPAVRQAIETDNAKARAEGRQETNPDALLTLAEGLLPRLKAAEWRDRADAAIKSVDEIGLRDLRAVVAGADAVARDDEARTLASQLREALDRRVTAELDEWLGGITGALDESRVVRALRLSAHPPDPASRLPAEVATRLADAASAAMSPEAMPERWATLLDAVSASPVRRSVKPAGLPTEPGPALLQAAQQASGRVPALAAMLGIDIPPPPGPVGGRQVAGRPSRPGREGARKGPRSPVPPRPPRPEPGGPRARTDTGTAAPPAEPPDAVAPTSAEAPAGRPGEPVAETGGAPGVAERGPELAGHPPAAAPPAADEEPASGWLPTEPPVPVPDSPAEALAHAALAGGETEAAEEAEIAAGEAETEAEVADAQAEVADSAGGPAEHPDPVEPTP